MGLTTLIIIIFLIVIVNFSVHDFSIRLDKLDFLISLLFKEFISSEGK